ncbi:hypothetical protein [Beggiatoa leptomitoformis]|uniref:Aspartate/glutamate/uridylate kinase domain-containing protein n=1 Tax=Beggiatoa leptomitoformis TaxID=288004 RepID=A0A2N9YHN1_9GAMM|nr:hypothetical protein [Beggiatoa leptomitoformis]ALG67751.1 hypothetical protein AL038_08570 [Beggiatoa leptomitoformis]AUI70007.1 hypothetical protein BLE401_15740 [Beggiatoa leptomitoformis]
MPWVIKIGGSLANTPDLPHLLTELVQKGRHKAVIVAGGGQFADQVRLAQARWHFPDSNAHQMALLAMEQYAWMLQGIQPSLQGVSTLAEIHTLLETGEKIPLWLPCQMTKGRADIEESWEMTSDSLAAWLAQQLQASRLILVKSAHLPTYPNSLEQWVQQGIVDACLPRYVGNFTVSCVNDRAVGALLRGDTQIG